MDKTLLDQLQYYLNIRRIGNTTAAILGMHNTRDTIFIVRDQRQAQNIKLDYGDKDGDVGNLIIKTIFDIPNLKGYNLPVIIDHFALSDLVTQHTAAMRKHYRMMIEDLENQISELESNE